MSFEHERDQIDRHAKFLDQLDNASKAVLPRVVVQGTVVNPFMSWSATEAAANIPAVYEYAKDKDKELADLRRQLEEAKKKLKTYEDFVAGICSIIAQPAKKDPHIEALLDWVKKARESQQQVERTQPVCDAAVKYAEAENHLLNVITVQAEQNRNTAHADLLSAVDTYTKSGA